MADIQAKKAVKKVQKIGRRNNPQTRARVAIVVLVIITLILAKAVWNIYQKNKAAEIGRSSTERQLNDLATRQKELEIKLSKLRTSQGIEEEIRKQLPVAKDGEHVIVIVGDDNVASDSLSSTTSKKGFWTSFVSGGR